MNYFHISEKNRNNEMFRPRIPSNTMDGEDEKTKRICVSTCISGCIRAIIDDHCYRFDDGIYYVHVPWNYKGKVIKPTKVQVPDVNVTKEKWLTSKVRMRCIGKIMVFRSNKRDPYKHYCGHSYRFRWIEKYDI